MFERDRRFSKFSQKPTRTDHDYKFSEEDREALKRFLETYDKKEKFKKRAFGIGKFVITRTAAIVLAGYLIHGSYNYLTTRYNSPDPNSVNVDNELKLVNPTLSNGTRIEIKPSPVLPLNPNK